jgi:ketosteroid isomerase-like protein
MSNGLDVLNDVRDAYMAAARSGDAEAFGATLTDDVVMLPPDAPMVTGNQAVVAWIAENYFDPFDVDLRFHFEDGEVHGSSAWTRGPFTLEIRPKDGSDPMTVRGKFIDIFRRDDDGNWKFSTWIWNADAPAQG